MRECRFHTFARANTYHPCYQVFLVAGGQSGGSLISSTETLVQGGQAWNFQHRLPSERYVLQGITLPDTVIMTGKKVIT